MLGDEWRLAMLPKRAMIIRTILAKYIITMAKGGERDTKWLADSAVLYLSQQKLTRQAPEAV